MKKILIVFAGITLLVAGNRAFAGLDWQIIEHERKIAAERWQQAEAQENAKRQQQSDEATAEKRTVKNCLEINMRPD